MPVPSARTPSRALVPDAYPRDAEPVLVRQDLQSARQLFARLLTQLPPLVTRKPHPRQRGSLAQYPIDVAPGEGIGFSF